MYHKLLQRQLKKQFGEEALPENLEKFLAVISSSYDHFDQDRLMLERSIDISSNEMIELNKKLKKESEELKKTNGELDRFVYSVSHDLRAPLTSMLGVVEISESITTEEIIRKQLGMVKTNIKKLDGFILDILDYSRNSRMEVKADEINFKELLNDIVSNLEHMGGTNRKVEINYNVYNGIPFYSDKSRLSILLNNLISNSIRYQNPEAEKPYVDVKINIFDKGSDITIQDNGIGISDEHLPKIFDMFYRVSDKSVGSGLGLHIVKETIEKLKGTISAESELGQGTTFNIHIPNNNSKT
jgi:signal transduction histidine kinase